MKEYKISVVVPIYNVEQYLHRSLDAIVNQTYKNLEIILIDDGAKDSSGKICDEYVARDSRIRVIHKMNEGAGIARNVALDCVTGDYVVFVDSDDYMELDMYEKMIAEAEKYHADLVICGADFIDSQNKLKRYNANPFENKKVFRNEEIQDVILNMLERPECTKIKSSYPIDMALWKGMFSREIIEKNHIRLCSERTHKSEDFIFYTEFVPKCKCVVLMEERLYYHCDNQASISHNYSVKVQKLNNAMLDKLLQHVKENNLSEECRLGAIRVYLEATFIVVLDEFRNHKKSRYCEIKDNIRYVCNDSVFKEYAKYAFLFVSEPKKKIILNLMRMRQNWLIYIIIKLQLMLKS